MSFVDTQVTDAFVEVNNDVVFKVGNKKITIKDSADTAITFSEDGVIYDADKISVTLGTKYSSKTAKTFDAIVTDN